MVVERLLCHYVPPFTVFYFCVQQTTSEAPKVSGLSAWELHNQKASMGFMPYPYIGIYMGQELRKTGVRQLSIYS